MNRVTAVDMPFAKFGYLIDMDGVIYRGSEPIPGALRFIADLHEPQISFRFLTNNPDTIISLLPKEHRSPGISMGRDQPCASLIRRGSGAITSFH
jgi:ribonucleotide monophosphatase NagD (HAD superfamily)